MNLSLNRLRIGRFSVVLALVALAGACGSRSSVTPRLRTVSIMGSARLTSVQLASWFKARQPQPPGVYRAGVPVETLAQHFLDEGAAEGVAGDVAFVQSIFETGWFRFSGTVPASTNNFAGIGATGSSASSAKFPNARIGIRAQIQHLRAYADRRAVTCTVPPLRHPCVDPRFDLVKPKGKARTWNRLGNGNWATSPSYGNSVVQLYVEALRFHGIR